MKNHLQWNWWKYLMVILLPTVIWCSVFQALAQPGKEQQVKLLYFGENLDAQALQQQLAEALPGLTDQQLRSVTVDTAQPEEKSYASLLRARCYEYDLILLEESWLRENLGQSIFVRLTEPMQAQFPNAQPYTEQTEDGDILTYGFVLYDIQNRNNFASCYSGSQRCYLFISPYSVNFDGLNENGTAGNDGALKAAQYLLEMTP